MKHLLITTAILGLTACSQVEIVDQPPIKAECPDPASRQSLGEGSTYRDLARTRAEAINGWELCHGALEIVQGDRDD